MNKGDTMNKTPVINLGECTECFGCIEVSPSVFRTNRSFGYLEIIDLPAFPFEEVEEAIKICPADCINWE